MLRHVHSPRYLAAFAILRTLRDQGHQAYFAGGCVRDLLLGDDPRDFDVATSATPDQVVALFPRTQSVGVHFGVILVLTDPVLSDPVLSDPVSSDPALAEASEA